MPNTAIRIGLAAIAAIAAMVAIAAPAHASDISREPGALEIEGDDDSDVITVSTDGTTLTVVDTGTGGATAGIDCDQVNGQTVTCPVFLAGSQPVDRFEVDLNNGTDSFTNTNFDTVDFGHVHSEDPISGGPASGVKTIVGGPGPQFIDGGAESDSISGGDGDDQFEDGGGVGDDIEDPTGGNDVVDGGAGEDTIGYFRGSTPLSLSFDDVANDGQAGETDNLLNMENAFTSNGNDTLIGNASANLLEGGGGNDAILGQGGNDQLFGEFEDGGNLLIRGIALIGPNNDTLVGGVGRDELDCGVGADVGLRDGDDRVDVTCERIGADVKGDSAALQGKKKNKAKITVACPESEGAPCVGKLKIRTNGKKIGGGSFNVNAGETKNAKAKLKKKGVKAVKKAGGSLLVSVSALTTEPGGVSESVGTVLLFR